MICEYRLPTGIDLRAGKEAFGLAVSESIVYGVEVEEKFYCPCSLYQVPVSAEIVRDTWMQSQAGDSS